MSDTDEYTQVTERRLCANCIGESLLSTEVDRASHVDGSARTTPRTHDMSSCARNGGHANVAP